MELTILYKTNMKSFKYFDAWKNFEEFCSLLNLDELDLNSYFNTSMSNTTKNTSFKNGLQVSQTEFFKRNTNTFSFNDSGIESLTSEKGAR